MLSIFLNAPLWVFCWLVVTRHISNSSTEGEKFPHSQQLVGCQKCVLMRPLSGGGCSECLATWGISETQDVSILSHWGKVGGCYSCPVYWDTLSQSHSTLTSGFRGNVKLELTFILSGAAVTGALPSNERYLI